MRRGLIRGPREDEEAFARRCAQCQPIAGEEWAIAHRRTQELFGFTVDWVPLTYSNQKLPFWEGAATWISETGLPHIQLRKAFKKGRHLGYSRDEILAHESVHAARMAFDEPRFEEIIAYQTSKSPLRRFFGPLFRRTWESALFMTALTLTPFFLPSLVIPAYFFFRLLRNQMIFRRCRKKHPLSVIIGLTDREIENSVRF